MSIFGQGPLRVYLAAPYSQKDMIKTYAEDLRQEGIVVTSSWLNEPHKPTTQMHDLTHEEHQQYAVQDIADVVAGHLLVFFTDPTKTIVRAGRHVEFGIALGLGLFRPMPIYVVGLDHENIFHHMPQVYHFPDWATTKAKLLELAKTTRSDE